MLPFFPEADYDFLADFYSSPEKNNMEKRS